jgi:hypothetical protein
MAIDLIRQHAQIDEQTRIMRYEAGWDDERIASELNALSSLGDAMKHIIEIPGAGPFSISLPSELLSLKIDDDLDTAVARFQLADGTELHVPLSSGVIDDLLAAMRGWRKKCDEDLKARSRSKS